MARVMKAAFHSGTDCRSAQIAEDVHLVLECFAESYYSGASLILVDEDGRRITMRKEKKGLYIDIVIALPE